MLSNQWTAPSNLSALAPQFAGLIESTRFRREVSLEFHLDTSILISWVARSDAHGMHGKQRDAYLGPKYSLGRSTV